MRSQEKTGPGGVGNNGGDWMHGRHTKIGVARLLAAAQRGGRCRRRCWAAAAATARLLSLQFTDDPPPTTVFAGRCCRTASRSRRPPEALPPVERTVAGPLTRSPVRMHVAEGGGRAQQGTHPPVFTAAACWRGRTSARNLPFDSTRSPRGNGCSVGCTVRSKREAGSGGVSCCDRGVRNDLPSRAASRCRPYLINRRTVAVPGMERRRWRGFPLWRLHEGTSTTEFLAARPDRPPPSCGGGGFVHATPDRSLCATTTTGDRSPVRWYKGQWDTCRARYGIGPRHADQTEGVPKMPGAMNDKMGSEEGSKRVHAG